MRIRQLLPALLLLAAFAATAPSAFAAERNVVLVITDDQGRDSAGCYGNPVIQTPNLDALAEDGTRFTEAFCTTASCSASRSVILTGLHNHRNGHYGHKHSFHNFESFEWIQSLPNLLNEFGYRTARVGKYHVAPEEHYRFDKALRASSRNPVQMADAAKDLIAEDSDEPFFLMYATSDPHRSGGWTERNGEKANRFGNRPEGKARNGIDPVHYDPEDVQIPPFLPDTPTARAEIAEYYQSVSRIDQGLGRLVQHLKDAGEYNNTLIIYISDHGIAFPGGKTTLYEGGMRSPCVVRNPYSEKRGIVTDAMVSWVDITPTILNFAGLLEDGSNTLPEKFGQMPRGKRQQIRRRTKPYTFHGNSFLPVLGKPSPEGWDRVNASHTFHEITMYYPMRVVRERRWKLIWNIAHDLPYPFASDLWAAPTWQVQHEKGMDATYGRTTVEGYIHRPEFELYDLKSDPNETNNLADDPDYQEKLEQMKAKLKQFQQQTDDPWIMKWDYE